MSVTSCIPQDAFPTALPELRGWCAFQVGQLQSSVEHELYSDKGPIADRHEHPARTSSMGHASDIKRSIYLHRQRQMTAMTLRAMGGRAIKRTHSVRTCTQPSHSRSMQGLTAGCSLAMCVQSTARTCTPSRGCKRRWSNRLMS